MKLTQTTAGLIAFLCATAMHASPTLIGSTATIDYLYPNAATSASSLTTLTLGGSITINDYFNLDGTSGVSSANFLAGNYVTETIQSRPSGYMLICPGADIGTGVCLNFREPTTITMSASSITIHENGGASFAFVPFNGLDFTNLNFGAGYSLAGFTLTTDLPGLTASDVSFTADSIEYNTAGLQFFNAPHTVTLDLNAAATTPEPGTALLLGVACAVIGSRQLFFRRR